MTDSLGQRVAAEGIEVWNPVFDVTPAALIDGIVTEFGVIAKAEGAESMDVPGFVAALCTAPVRPCTARRPSALMCTMPHSVSRSRLGAAFANALRAYRSFWSFVLRYLARGQAPLGREARWRRHQVPQQVPRAVLPPAPPRGDQHGGGLTNTHGSAVQIAEGVNASMCIR